jgi:hypothetical protein
MIPHQKKRKKNLKKSMERKNLKKKLKHQVTLIKVILNNSDNYIGNGRTG